MIGRRTRIAFKTVAAALSVLVVVVGVVFWRLAQGPVELDFLTPRLEASLSELEEDVDVALGGTVLEWQGWPRTFALRARDVTIRSEGEEVAHVPAIDLTLSFSALLSRVVAPTAITVHGVYLTVVRDEEGFHLGAPGDAMLPDPEDISRFVTELLDDLMAAPDPARRLSYLEDLRIDDMRLTMRDMLLDSEWTLPGASLALHRVAGGITGTGEMALVLDEEKVPVDAALRYTAADERVDIAASVRGLRPSAFAEGVPQLAAVRDITTPLSGTVTASMSLSGKLGEVNAELAGGAGTLAIPGIVPQPRPVKSAFARVRLSPEQERLALDDMHIDFGMAEEPGPRVTGSITANEPTGDMTVALQAEARDLPMEQLEHYWSPILGAGGRAWTIENIPTGMTDAAEIKLRMVVPGGDFDAARLTAMSGNIAYSGAEVHYMRPLPPVSDVRGTAHFDMESFRLQVTGGSNGRLRLKRADIDITGLDTEDNHIAIDFDVEGPLRDGLQLLDHPTLQLATGLGVGPEKVSGQGRANARFTFPLVEDLRMDDVEMRATAELSEVAVSDFLLGQDASGGRFDLAIDKRGMLLSGPVDLAGVPLQMSWQQWFEETAEFSSQFSAQIPLLDDATRAGMGLEASPFLEGPVSAAVVARSGADGGSRVKSALNLQDAELFLPGFDWRKEQGVPARANFVLRFEDERLVSLDSFEIVAEDAAAPLSAKGSGRFATHGDGLDRVHLEAFELGDTRLRDVATERQEDAWVLRLGGGRLDAAPFVAGLSKDEPDMAVDGGAPELGVPLEVRAGALERLSFGEGRHLTNVGLGLRRKPDGGWERLRLDARVPAKAGASEAGSLLLDYGTRGDGRRELTIEADDSGAALYALNLVDSMEGGRLRVEGLSRGAEPGSPLDASIDLRDFKLVNAPILARLLTLGSLTGILDRLSGDGINFQELSGDVVLEDATLSSDLLHAYGPSLGITAKGSIDLLAASADLNGTIVPAASINRVLGNIPLVGSLITGGKGEGVIAMNYRMTGPLEDPRIAVNPLSALTPGFLRNLFGFLSEARTPDESRSRAVQPGLQGP